MPVGSDDLKYILSLDIEEAEKELKVLEQQAGKTFDPMLAAGKKLAAEMKVLRDQHRAEQAEALAVQFRPTESLLSVKNLGKVGNAAGALGAAATAASSGLSGGQLGDISGGIAGMFHPEAAGVGAIVAGAAKVIEAPFALIAKFAQNAARALGELEGPLGVVGVGMEKTAQSMEYIPVIGQHLAAAERASKQMMEQNLRFMGKLSPAFSEMLQAAKDDIEALKTDKEKAKGVKQANEFYRDVLGSSGENPESLRRQLESNSESGRSVESVVKENARLNRQLEFQQAAEQGKKEYLGSKEGDLFKSMIKVDAETYKNLFGKEFKPGAGVGAAAKPAQFSSFMDYERQMQQKAFSQGVDPSEQRFNTVTGLMGRILEALGHGGQKAAGRAIDGVHGAAINPFAGFDPFALFRPRG